MKIVKNKIYQYQEDKQYYIVIKVSKYEVAVLPLDLIRLWSHFSSSAYYYCSPTYFKSNFKPIPKLKEILLYESEKR